MVVELKNRLKVGCYLHLNGHATLKVKCMPNGLVGRDSASQVFLCERASQPFQLFKHSIIIWLLAVFFTIYLSQFLCDEEESSGFFTFLRYIHFTIYICYYK
ncbi:hypothetical protein FW717_03070 [Salmonella enterica subsp. enterica serovar Ago]|nr:hypothetical protein [Salmonella enterica]EDQ9935655.1 hypothetical protein [Salmonella enterica subsp. enterica]EDV9048898.1 hypothetical protein [Salmonella enterica subsp. enterica serovar Ago]EEJ6642908.1 hypothetical protein [Salmonella enterica subsp. enterica serovar Aderike]EDS7164717.1 hypothetical protein [Salmonella enterica]